MKRATLIQFDIETLSLHPTNAVVGEIGIHVLHLSHDDEGVHTESDAMLSILLDMEAQQRLGRKIDTDTIQWWLNQNEKARAVMARRAGRVAIIEAIIDVDTFVRKHLEVAAENDSRVFILSSAPAFDLTNIRSLYAAAKMEHPWQHWQEHSQRTLRKIGGHKNIPARVMGFEHGGMADAVYQNDVLLAQMNSSDAGAIALQQFFFGD